MRERLGISEEHLRACVQDHYDISAVTLELLHMGWDSMAAVYRVVSAQGTPFLLRVKSGLFYAPSCLVPRHLKDQGIDAVVAPLPTKRHSLWIPLGVGEWGEWMVTLYPFIEGDIGWHPSMTDAQWKAVGAILKQIHQVPLPPEGMQALRKETFSSTAYARWVRTFDTQLTHVAHAEDESRAEQAIRDLWMKHRSMILAMLAAMETLAETLQGQSGPQVICHADLHPGNLIRDAAGHVHVIDWDDVMLAPKERDFIFVREAPADSSARASVPPFFRGYGQVEIDWVALTYYHFERVVQDVIECAQEVLFRSDLAEDARLDAAQLFGDIFTTGDTVVAAWAAAAHLPAHLRIHNNTGS